MPPSWPCSTRRRGSARSRDCGDDLLGTGAGAIERPPGMGRRSIRSLRQREREDGALARLAPDPDGASVQAEDVTDNRQADPGSLVPLARARVDLVEALEDPLVFLGRDTDSGVPHLHLQESPRTTARRQGDSTALPVELDGV